MRDIIFRGKLLDSGEWVYGTYYFHSDLMRGFIINIGIDHIGPMAWTQEVDPKTVGQYTGVKDKNKERIFEGDIISFENGFVGEIKWDTERARFMITSKGILNAGVVRDSKNGYIEVVGNVLDNSNLLK